MIRITGFKNLILFNLCLILALLIRLQQVDNDDGGENLFMGAPSDEYDYFQEDLATIAFPCFDEMRREQRLCDVTIKVSLLRMSSIMFNSNSSSSISKIDGSLFLAHRVVLAATIPYFKAMFTCDMMEARQDVIDIQQSLDGHAFECLLNFAYTGQIRITTANVQSILVASSFLQLTKVRDACCDFLKKRLHANNVLGVKGFADTLGCVQLVEAAHKFIEKQFEEVAKSEEFLHLSFHEVTEMISKDELNVRGEETVFEAVMAWVKKDPDKRSTCLPHLLTHVRLPLMTPQYLTDFVATEQLIRSSHACRDLLDEAKDYHLMPERRPLLQSFRTRPRCSSDVQGLIYAVGGLTKNGDSLSTVEVYDPQQGRWRMAEAMTMLRSRVGVAVMDLKLYAIGGYNGSERLSTVEVFDPEKKTWTKVAPMNCKRRYDS